MNQKEVSDLVLMTFESLFEYVGENGQTISHNHFLELVAESCDYRYTEQRDLDEIIDLICDSCDLITRDGDTINLKQLDFLWKRNWPVKKIVIEEILGRDL